MTHFDFTDLLRPLSPATFASEYWESRPLHVARRDPRYYRDLFTARDFDTLLAQSRPRFPQLRVAAKERPMPAEQLLDGGWLSPVQPGRSDEAKAVSLYRAYADGYTLIVELQRLWRPVSLLCRSIEEAYHHKASAELYLTPKGAQGFDLHFDLHDVFLLQIDGAKRWQVFAPGEPLPVSERRVTPEELSGPPLIEEILEAGDLLYIPRGFPHQGFTADRASLHITFGVFVHRWQDLLAEALHEVAERDVRFRQSLPLALLAQADGFPGLHERLRELCAALLEDHRGAAALERLATGFLGRLEPVADGHFQQIDGLAEVTLESRVVKRTRSLCLVTTTGDTTTLHFPGGAVAAPGWVAPALRFVRDQQAPFRVAALPDDLDGESKVVLARRLVKEGLLRVAAGDRATADPRSAREE